MKLQTISIFLFATISLTGQGIMLAGGAVAEEPAYEPIVFTDLLYNLDAGKTDSYSGSGVTWLDLQNSYDATLINGVGFSSNNGGVLDFDGTNDYASLGTPSLLSGSGDFTVEMWLKFDVLGSNYYTFYSYGGFVANGFLVQRANDGRIRLACNPAFYDTDVVLPLAINTWYHIVVVVVSGVPTTTYVNNTAYSMSRYSTTAGVVNVINPKQVDIGRRTDGGGLQYFDGKISMARLYSNDLSATDVTQNWNAQKERFGY